MDGPVDARKRLGEKLRGLTTRKEKFYALREMGLVRLREKSRGGWIWELTSKGRALQRELQKEETNVHANELQDQEGDEGSLQERADD